MENYYRDKIIESPWQRYRRLVSGDVSWPRLITEEILLSFLSPIKGLLGMALRRSFYGLIMKGMSPRAIIDHSVTIRCPSFLAMGKGCFVESYVHLLGSSAKRPAVHLEDGVHVRSYSIINAGPPEGFVRIGQKSTVAHHCIIHGHGGVTIGQNVMLAGQCMIVASMHVHSEIAIPIKDQGFTARGISIEDDVWLGAGVKVLDGVKIGKGSIVGAGSVVTSDLPAFSVAVGVPAVVKKGR